MPEIKSYEPRHIRALDPWEVTGVTFKPYVVTGESGVPPSESLIASAREYVVSHFPAVCEAEGHHHGLGYVVLHAAEMRSWLLIHWWAHGNIVLGMLAASYPGSTDFSSQDDRPFHACVWEHVVINYERDAWIRHMMREQSDSLAYREDRLPDAAY